MKKYGRGEIIPEPDDIQKAGSKEWTAEDEEALQSEGQEGDDVD